MPLAETARFDGEVPIRWQPYPPDPLKRFDYARRTRDLPESPTVAIEWYREEPDGRIIEDLPSWRVAVDDLEKKESLELLSAPALHGLRKTEAMTLRWRDVQKDRIHLPMTNGTHFDLPILDLHPDLLEAVRGPSPPSAAGYSGTRSPRPEPAA